jgi:hypothetical protein
MVKSILLSKLNRLCSAFLVLRMTMRRGGFGGIRGRLYSRIDKEQW